MCIIGKYHTMASLGDGINFKYIFLKFSVSGKNHKNYRDLSSWSTFRWSNKMFSCRIVYSLSSLFKEFFNETGVKTSLWFVSYCICININTLEILHHASEESDQYENQAGPLCMPFTLFYLQCHFMLKDIKKGSCCVLYTIYGNV